MQSVTVDPRNPRYYDYDNCIYDSKFNQLVVGCNDGKILDDGRVSAIIGDSFEKNLRVKELVLPQSVKRVDNAAFRGCVNLRRVVLNKTLEHIGRCAFEGCTSLKEIEIPQNVKTIEGHAFGKSGLERVVIKRGVEVIEEAFFRCESLREVYVPSSVKKISYSAFSFCNPSVRIYVETDANKNYER